MGLARKVGSNSPLSPNGGEGRGEGGIKSFATPTLTLPPQGGGDFSLSFPSFISVGGAGFRARCHLMA